MVDKEKVDKASNTTSEISTEKTDKISDEESTKISNKTSNASTEISKNFICEECGKAFETKRQLIGHMRVHSKKAAATSEEEVIDEFLDEKETLSRIIAEATPTRKRKSIVRMVSRHLDNKKESIETLMEALRLADVDPGLRSIIVKNWASHMDVPDIEDVLAIERKEAKEEKKKEGEKKTEEDREKEKEKTSVDPVKEVYNTYRVQKAERLKDKMDAKKIAEMEREMSEGKEGDKEEKKYIHIVDGVPLKVTAQEMLAWKRYTADERRAEEEREERKEERKQQAAERQRLINERNSQNDGGLVEWVVGEGNNTRIIKARPETIPLLMAQGKNPSQNPNVPSREEVAQMVERTIEAQAKKLTPDDVERIVQNAVSNVRSVTKDEWKYREAKDNYNLEEKKLDESGKTRDVIGKAITEGFSHAGNIIGRMMTGEGETTGRHVEGHTDQGGNMMQVACPGCNTVITAPVGSPMVVCPGCGKRWMVEPPGHEQTPPKVEEKKPPEEVAHEEKEVIEKSMEDAKRGRMKPLETDAPAIISEPITAATVTPEPTTDASSDVIKIAEGIAIGEGVKKLEEELKKESPVKKKTPARPSKICPVCKKKFKNRRGVASHIAQKHPGYKK